MGWLAAARNGRWMPFYEPASDPIRNLAVRHLGGYLLLERTVWALAILLDAGDLVTTYIGIGHPQLVEAAPISRWVLAHFGVGGLLVEHVLAVGILIGLWGSLPPPYRLVVPWMTAWTSYAITRSNLVELVEHGVVAAPW